jgi:predicted amidohydrolase
VVQLNTRTEKPANVARAIELIRAAAGYRAEVVALPEVFAFCGPVEDQRRHAEAIPGPTIDRIADVARECRVHVLAGSIHERVEGQPKLYNTSVLIDSNGVIVARYRKIHLFLAPGLDDETPTVQPGSEIVVADSAIGRCGFSICYDLRFPELYRELSSRGAEIIFAPAAFTLQNGRDHWEVLVRARAVENLAYVVAPDQFGPHPPGKMCYGHSMIVDPWGTVLARVPDGEGVAVADVDLRRVAELRGKLPALEHRRLGQGLASGSA